MSVLFVIVMILIFGFGLYLDESFNTRGTVVNPAGTFESQTTTIQQQLTSRFSTTSATSDSFQTAYNITFTGQGNNVACCIGYVTNYTTATTDYTVGAKFYYPISINYSGSWNLVYWVKYATGDLTNVAGNLDGSGNYEATISFNVVGYVQETLCASATKLDSSQNNLALTLTVLGTTSNTTSSNPKAEACGTMAV